MDPEDLLKLLDLEGKPPDTPKESGVVIPATTERTGPYRRTSRSASDRPSTMHAWYTSTASAATLREACSPL